MLTVLSFGAGQDSAALWNMYRYDDKGFRKRYAPGDFIVICADTGNEHPETYRYIEEVKTLSMIEGIRFVHITPDMGYHGEGWHSLDQQYDTRKNVGSKAFFKTCTDKLKIQPIYKFLGEYVDQKYSPPGQKKIYKGKAPLVAYAEQHGPIKVLIGFAHGEQTRVGKAKDEDLPQWQVLSTEKEYPLLDMEMDRQACQDYVRSKKATVPWPSCCLKCPWMNLQELLWLSLDFPEVYADWCRQEEVKLEKFKSRGDKNLGVWGSTKKLPEMLEIANKKHGHMSPEELREYRFSHGHCVKSKH